MGNIGDRSQRPLLVLQIEKWIQEWVNVDCHAIRVAAPLCWGVVRFLAVKPRIIRAEIAKGANYAETGSESCL